MKSRVSEGNCCALIARAGVCERAGGCGAAAAARGREGAGQPALRTAERPHHRAGAAEKTCRSSRSAASCAAAPLADPADKPGVASLVAGLLDRGAGKRSAFEFADAVEGVGGSFSAGAGAESISVSGQFLARDRALMIELLADALMRPHFDAAGVRKLPRSRDRVHQVGQGFRSFADSSASTAAPRCSASIPSAVRKAAASARSPRITQSDVVSYHAANFGADRATLVFAGDLDPKWMSQALTTAFGGWAKAKAALPVAQTRAARHGHARVAGGFSRLGRRPISGSATWASIGATAAVRRSTS